VPIENKNDNPHNKKIIKPTTGTTTESLTAEGKKQQLQQQQVQEQEEQDHSHKGENCHSKNTRGEELDNNEKLISNLKEQIKDELEKQEKEQQILLKENKQNIIDFIVGNKDSIRIEDLKIYEPVYKCYREKGNCIICNTLTNIICTSCSNNSNHMNNKEIWLCTNHWQEHALTYY
jgi:hypothetical protein